MSEVPGPGGRFTAELQALYDAAGSPKHQTLIHQARRQQPPVTLNAASLSDWFRGASVPSKPDVTRFLVEFLQARAEQHSGYRPRRLEWWLELRQQAWNARQASRRVPLRSRARRTERVTASRLGKPIGDYTPLALEVHPAITIQDDAETAPVLPRYVPRAHDIRLRQVVDAAAGGTSQIATLVGGPSTGKTRACWEAIQTLDERWWLWHPIDPSRPAAAAAALAKVGRHTVIWLNEAQYYLLNSDPAVGEHIAAGLRTLLTDPARAPVLVLATVWPRYWASLTMRPMLGADPYGQARELLTGTDIPVPDAFTGPDLHVLREEAKADPRLADAAAHAEVGRITQYLAGVPELLQRFRNAPPVARAIIHAAMDVRRLGLPLAIPGAFLEQAVPGYLNDHEWDQAGNDWLGQGLRYTETPCHGTPGPVARIRPRPSNETTLAQPSYRLADYLEHIAPAERAGVFPPGSFWDAAAATAMDPEVLRSIGVRAERRGRYQRAAHLYRLAADRGDVPSLWNLAKLHENSGDWASAEKLYRQVAERGGIGALQDAARVRETAGDPSGAAELYRQLAERGSINALRGLARLRETAGDPAGAEAAALLAAKRGNTGALRDLARLRVAAGDPSGAEAAALRAAEHHDDRVLQELARLRELVGDPADAEELYRKAAEFGNSSALQSLVRLRELGGDPAGAEATALQAANHYYTGALLQLAFLREEAGDLTAAEALYRPLAERGDCETLMDVAVLREAASDPVGAAALYQQVAERCDPDALMDVARLREETGDRAGAETAAQQAAESGNTGARQFLAQLQEAADPAGAQALYRQAAESGNTSALRDLARLREETGDRAGAEAAARQAAALGDTRGLCDLARLCEEAGDRAGAEALYEQAVNCVDVDAVSRLARFWERAGKTTGAQLLRRFGLTDDGSPAMSLEL